MNKIADAITKLINKMNELRQKYATNNWENHDDMHSLWIRLAGRKEGYIYALQMLGLDIEITEDGARIIQATYVRD